MGLNSYSPLILTEAVLKASSQLILQKKSLMKFLVSVSERRPIKIVETSIAYYMAKKLCRLDFSL